ncbi:MAG: DHH family phosphoesterase [Christensenellaceae bacterium]|jgi:c-di-AMP phosphodiesterase-like protein
MNAGNEAVEKRRIMREIHADIRAFSVDFEKKLECFEHILVMGHELPDLDVLGAALGMLSIARHMKKTCHIVLEEPNVSIHALWNELRRRWEYDGVFVSAEQACEMVQEKTVLVIVDTQMESYSYAPELVEAVEDIVVIDHHIKSSDRIKCPTLVLHETEASSASELVTGVLRELGAEKVLYPLEAEALLAGIKLDTKGFSLNTSVATFEAATFLAAHGADSDEIHSFFLDDIETFRKRTAIVMGAEFLPGGIALAHCPGGDVDTPQLLAAQVADELMNIRGMLASFVLCQRGTDVMISGRSLGQVNVQSILSRLNGGGHANSAGAQLKETDMQTAKGKLLDAIKQYGEETGQ